MQEILSKTRFAGFLIWNKKSGSALIRGAGTGQKKSGSAFL
jgi:hypothetical protein